MAEGGDLVGPARFPPECWPRIEERWGGELTGDGDLKVWSHRVNVKDCGPMRAMSVVEPFWVFMKTTSKIVTMSPGIVMVGAMIEFVGGWFGDECWKENCLEQNNGEWAEQRILAALQQTFPWGLICWLLETPRACIRNLKGISSNWRSTKVSYNL
jgi:hypothetical protein